VVTKVHAYTVYIVFVIPKKNSKNLDQFQLLLLRDAPLCKAQSSDCMSSVCPSIRLWRWWNRLEIF